MLETARSTRTDGRRDLYTELLGLWLVLAVFLDGWAHINLPSLETFFTPWHAALYSGMLATAAWTAVVIWRNRTPGQPLLQAIPPGYRGTAAGVILFGTAGGLDLLWHELLGIEVSLDALVSPTHLLLGFSLFLILGTAVRSSRAAVRSAQPGGHRRRSGSGPGWRRDPPLLAACGAVPLWAHRRSSSIPSVIGTVEVGNDARDCAQHQN